MLNALGKISEYFRDCVTNISKGLRPIFVVIFHDNHGKGCKASSDGG